MGREGVGGSGRRALQLGAQLSSQPLGAFHTRRRKGLAKGHTAKCSGKDR